jgi:hypothetical protein
MEIFCVGFAEVDDNGNIIAPNENVKCLNDECSQLEWDEAEISRTRIQSNHIAKNSITLPAEGRGRHIYSLFSSLFYIILHYYSSSYVPDQTRKVLLQSIT